MMNLTEKDVVKYITLIQANFAAYTGLSDEQMQLLISSWHEILKPYAKEACDKAVMLVIKNSKFPPRVSDIVSEIETMQIAVTGKTDTALWEELKSALIRSESYAYAVSNFYGNPADKAWESADKLFNTLSPEVREYLHCTKGMLDLSELTDEQLSFEKGRFLKQLPSIREYTKLQSELPPEYKSLFAGTQLKQIGG